MATAEVSALLTAFDVVAAADPELLSAWDLVSDQDALCELEHRLRALQAARLAVAIERDATVEVTGRAPRSWLIEEQLFNPGEASRRLRLAVALPSNPAIRAEYERGWISSEHALVVLDALRQVPTDYVDAVESALLELCREYPPYVVARCVDEILVRLGVESSSDEAAVRRHQRRGFDVGQTFGGTGSASGTLTPTLTEKLLKLFADCGTPGGPEDDRCASQRRHDLLEDVVDHYLGCTREPEPAVQVVVTIPLDTLLDQLSTQWGLLDSGATISPATARRLACDADIIPAVLNARGDVLDVGVASRSFSTAVKRAAKLRDHGRCAFPRCTRPVKECHHIVWWSRGGRSSIDNAAWLCTFHHWLAHEGGWTLRRNHDNSYTWTNPRGVDMTGDPPPRHTSAA